MLTILKKFPQKVDDITGKIDNEKSTIHDVKKLHINCRTTADKFKSLEYTAKMFVYKVDLFR